MIKLFSCLSKPSSITLIQIFTVNNFLLNQNYCTRKSALNRIIAVIMMIHWKWKRVCTKVYFNITFNLAWLDTSIMSYITNQYLDQVLFGLLYYRIHTSGFLKYIEINVYFFLTSNTTLKRITQYDTPVNA